MNYNPHSTECNSPVVGFIAPAHHKERTYFQEEAKLRVRSRLPTLRHSSGRKVRSEFTGAVQTTLECLLHHLNLETLKVGKPTSGQFFSYTYTYLATRCGFTLIRVKRALAYLRRAGYITTKRRFTHRVTHGSEPCRWLAATIKINLSLFEALGFSRRRLGRELRSLRAEPEPEKPAAKIRRSSRKTAQNMLDVLRGILGRAPPKEPVEPIL